MQPPQTLGRRILPALLVTALSSVLLGAVVVAADNGSAAKPVPAFFGVAAPALGDGWRYSATLGGDWTFRPNETMQPGAARPFAELHWTRSGTVRGGDGLMHDANHVQTETWAYDPAGFELDGHYDPDAEDWVEPDVVDWVPAESSAWVLAGSPAIVQSGLTRSDNHTFTNYGLLGVGASVEHSTFAYGRLVFPADESPCLAANALQGANASLAVPLPLFGRCTLLGSHLGLPAGLSFQALAVETVNGVESVRFQARQDGATYDAWFTPSLPYPVRLAFDLPAPPAKATGFVARHDHDVDGWSRSRQAEAQARQPGARTVVLDLVGFTAGDQPLDGADNAVRDPAPALASAGRQPWGLDDKGLQHPFPLSTAYQGALDAAGYADLRTYLSTHPGGYVAGAAYGERQSQQGLERTWSVALTDGREDFEFSATQTSADPYLPVPLRGNAQPVVTYESHAHQWIPHHSVLPDRVPAQAPTAASALARWAAFDGSNTTGNAYGFAVRCEGEERTPGCKGTLTVFAGVVRENYGPLPFLPFAPPGDLYGTERLAFVERLATFDADGRARTLDVRDSRHESSAAPSGPLPSSPVPSSPGDPGFALQASAIAGIAPTKWLPEPEQAAGIGFVGLLLGALYWVWPKLKALAFLGLFSRLERGELLEHPSRARLVQLVEANPGIHFHDLARQAGLANGSAVHHLRKLTAAGLVSARRSGRYTCYFPGSSVDAAQAAAAPVLKSDGAKLVLDTVRRQPGLSNLEVSQATGLQPSTVNYHVQRLAHAGLVEPLRDGRTVRLHPGARSGQLGSVAA